MATFLLAFANHSVQACLDGTYCGKLTCCNYRNIPGIYACCPFIEGVCCTDGLHCCPSSYTCLSRLGECVSSGNFSVRYTLSAAPLSRPDVSIDGVQGLSNNLETNELTAVEHVSAEDDHSDVDNTCPDGRNCHYGTCCQLLSKEWACCAQTNAVCCSDHIHCCPQGSVCNVKNRSCDENYHNSTLHQLRK